MRRQPLVLLLLSVLLWPAVGVAQSGGFGKNKVQYRAFDWKFISTENFDIYFYEGGYDLAVFAGDVLEAAYVEVSEQLNHRLRRRVPVILYEAHNDFQQTNITGGILEEGVGGFTESFKNRMVMPFTGSYEDFRHVLHHELTHAVTFDKLYGPGVGSILSSRALFRLPLWFAEGFAEYSSRHGWDTFADMVLRDAIVHDYLPPLEYSGGFLVYKQGQSAMLYLAERYGEEKIAEVLNRGRFESNLDRSLEKAIGMGVRDFEKAWHKRLRKEYWPEISEREEPKDFARQLTDHEKDGSYFNDKAVFSPRGDRLAVLVERGDHTEVRIISAIDGKKLKRILKGGKSDSFESLHSFQSGMSFSPDGSQLALIAKSKGEDALFLVSVDGKRKNRVMRLGFASMRSPVFAPDGASVVFTAARHDRNDLYRVDLATEDVQRLTDDHYDEQDADFDPTGTKLIFSSDRPAGEPAPLRLPGTQNPRSFAYGRYNIFEADLTTGMVRALTDSDAEDKMPVYAPDGQRICFVSNRNGIYNLYLIDAAHEKPYPVTDALSGCFSPTWSPDGTSIAFTAFFRAGFDIFLMTDIRPKGDSGEELALTAFMQGQIAGDSGAVLTKADIRLADRSPRTIDETLEFTSYVKRAEGPYERKPLAISDSVNVGERAPGQTDEGRGESSAAREIVFDPGAAPGTGEATAAESESVAAGEEPATTHSETVSDTLPYEVHSYKRKFSPDLVTGGLGYDTFFGLRGQSFFVISDYMGDHQIYIVSDLINTIDQSNIQVYYAYRARRIDYGIGLFHSKYYYVNFENRLFSDRTYGFLANTARPFSKFTRLQLDGTLIFIDRAFSTANPATNKFDDDRFARVGLGALSLVHDDISWGITGPVNGRRYRLAFEYAPPGLSKGISYQAVSLDFRQYTRIGRRYTFALRFGAGVSGGESPKRFYLGGVENWIGTTIGRNDVYDVEGLYFSQAITPLRGYDFYELSGNKYFVLNAEFRFPFVDRLAMRFPLPLVLTRVGGALFADFGSAWRGNDFRGVTTAGGFRLNDIRASFGYGLRANLGFLVLRFDQAWRTDLREVAARPKFYFSLGADY